MRFRIVLTSPPDRTKVVAEIWHDSAQLIELSNEHDALALEIYPCPSGAPWHFGLEEFLTALATAKARLLNEDTEK